MNNNLLAGTGSNEVTNPIFGDTYKGLLSSSTGGGDFFGLVIPKFVGILFVVGGVAFFFMLVWGAIGWILSGGDKAGVESAKNKITNAIIGMILLIASFAIVKLIEGFFGIDILSIDIGPLVIQ